ncbi:MAG: DUF5683 domain-containing protein [Bacteroidota bacterium]|jgi:hypothetical protein
MVACKYNKIILLCISLVVFNTTNSFSQTKTETKSAADTAKKVRSIAAKAAIRSAILPGLGQIYNKKYWKLPLVYGALAIPVSTFKYNSDWYTKTRFAYTTRVTNDTANFKNIARELQPISTEALRTYRNSFRKNMDFSVLGLLLMWGLNVVDATVDGHLRTFNISDDLTMSIQPSTRNFQQGFGMTATLHF